MSQTPPFVCPKCSTRIESPSGSWPPGTRAVACPKCQAKVVIDASGRDATKAKLPIAKPLPQSTMVVQPAISESSEVLATTEAIPNVASISRFQFLLAAMCGCILGILLALSLSGLKIYIHLYGILTLVLLLGLVLGIIAAVHASITISVSVASSKKRGPLSQLLLNWTKNGTTFLAGCFAICALLFVAEIFGPPEGHVRGYFSQSQRTKQQTKLSIDKAQQKAEIAAKEVEQEKAKELERQKAASAQERLLRERQRQKDDEEKWGKADFLLVTGSGRAQPKGAASINPVYRAIGFKQEGTAKDPRFDIIAEANEEQTTLPLTVAWNAGIPVLDDSSPLTRRICDKYDPGQSLVGQDSIAFANIAAFRPLVPTGTKFVSYVDKSKERHTGHLLRDLGEKFTFCDLVPRANPVSLSSFEPLTPEQLFHIETIDRQEILPGSDKVVLDYGILRKNDFLEYCIYTMLEQLQRSIQENNAGLQFHLRPCIYVDDVLHSHLETNYALEELRSTLARLKSERTAAVQGEIDRLDRPSAGGVAAVLRFLTELRTDMDREKSGRKLSEERKNAILEEEKAISAQIKSLTELMETGRQVKTDVQRLLLHCRVRVVDRSEQARGAYGQVDGNKWLRATADSAIHDGLINATHLLLSEVDRPRDDRYGLRLRLIDVKTGEILWADSGSCYLDGHQPSLETATPPTEPEVADLNGEWIHKRPAGPFSPGTITLKCTENTGGLKMSLVSDNQPGGLTKFELTAVRNANDLLVKECYYYFANAPKRQFNVTSEAKLELLNPQALELSIPSFKETKPGSGEYVRVRKEVSQLVFTKAPK